MTEPIEPDRDRLAEEVERLKAALAKAEAELALYDTSAADARICKQQMIEARHARDSERARAEKAEAERDAFRARLKPSIEYVEGAAVGYGDDEIDRLDARLLAERVRADRYLAAMRPVAPLEVVIWGDLDVDCCHIQIRWTEWQSIRRIVEEDGK